MSYNKISHLNISSIQLPYVMLAPSGKLPYWQSNEFISMYRKAEGLQSCYQISLYLLLKRREEEIKNIKIWEEKEKKDTGKIELLQTSVLK